MTTTLPGAEYAPVVRLPAGAAFDPGQRLDNHTCLMSADEGGAFMGRRLSCTDPDDQRAIWRRAAIHLGYDEETASTAVLSLRQMPEYEEVVDWMLVVHAGLCDEEYLWSPHGDLDPPESREEATAALCASVWGPK